jgi:hypothetical protein
MTEGVELLTPSGRTRGGGATSARKVEANRRNARASTGPRTVAGKARAAQNAHRHGLNLPARYDPSRSGEIDALARVIAGADAGAERLELASRIAAAQIDVERARRARLDIYPQALRERDAIARLAAIDRYEGRALSARKRAMCDYDDAADCAHSGMLAGISAERSHRAKVRRMLGNGGLGVAGVSFKLSARSIYPWDGPEAALIRSMIAESLRPARPLPGHFDKTKPTGEKGAQARVDPTKARPLPRDGRASQATAVSMSPSSRDATAGLGRSPVILAERRCGRTRNGGAELAHAPCQRRAPGLLAQRRNEATGERSMICGYRRRRRPPVARCRIIAALGTVRRTSGRTKPTVESTRVATLPNHLLLRCRYHLARRVDHGMDAAGELDCAGDVHVERSARIILAAHARRPRRPHDLCA